MATVEIPTSGGVEIPGSASNDVSQGECLQWFTVINQTGGPVNLQPLFRDGSPDGAPILLADDQSANLWADAPGDMIQSDTAGVLVIYP